jgi:hypothetical protein
MVLVLRNHNVCSAGLPASTTARQVRNSHTLLALESLKPFYCDTSDIENYSFHKILAPKMCLPLYSVNLPSWTLKEVLFSYIYFLTVAQPIGLLNLTCKTSGYFCGAFEGFTLLECYLVPVCSWLPRVWVNLSVPKQYLTTILYHMSQKSKGLNQTFLS